MSNFMNIAESVMEKVRRMGAQSAEVYLCKTKELNIQVRENRVETLKLAEDCGMGVRVFKDQRAGFSFTSDFSTSGLERIAGQVIASCQRTSEDYYNILPLPASKYPQLSIYDARIKESPVEQKIQMAKMMEETALMADDRVRTVESSTYQDGEVSIIIINSHGLNLSYQGAYCGMYLALVAGEGNESQSGFAMDYFLEYDRLNPEQIGLEAVHRAVRMLGASRVDTHKTTILLEPYVAAGFLGLLGPALSAEAVQKGRSLFDGRIDSKVASSKVTIIDNGILPGGIASAPFDGEGVATSKTILIKEGVLKSYLHNTYTANKDGVKSTGNGIRRSFKDTPEVGSTNLYIKNGNKTLEQLVSGIGKGLYVTEVLGMHTANPISGDFSVGVSGLLIKDGKIDQPVRGVAIGGNIIRLLEKIDEVGNDLKFFGARGSPTLSIPEITVSG